MEKNETQAKTIMEIARKMSKNYRSCFPPVPYQISKVFNHGMGSLAFLRAVPEDKVLLINRGLMSKSERARFEKMLEVFKGWRIVEVSLGYPDWYFTRDLRDMYIKMKKESKL